MSKQHIFFVLLFFFCSFNGEAQKNYDVEGLSLEKENEAWFDKQLGQAQSGVIIGEYANLNVGCRFDATKQWVPGKICYLEKIYSDVSMIYNAEDDQIFIKHPAALDFPNQQLLPFQDQVKWFEVGAHLFKYSSEPIAGVDKGFFEEIYSDSKLEFLAKQLKVLTLTVTGESYYEPVVQYIIKKDESYYRYYGKNSMFKVFGEHKKAIRQYAKSQRIKFRPSRLKSSEFEKLFEYISSLREE